MKKSLLLGIALAVAVAGNAKDAVHVEASINSIDQTAYKAADRYSNKKMTSVKKDFSTIETREREIKPYIRLNDQIQKIVVVNQPIDECLDDNGFTIIGASDFLLKFIK